jgi:hypothetical protein
VYNKWKPDDGGGDDYYYYYDYDEVGIIVEHIIAGCSLLSESAYPGGHSQLAKMIHKQIATKYRLFNRNTLPYYRYRPKLLLDQLT